MPTALRFLALPLLLAASPALAQSVFDGTWKGDISSLQVQSRPDSFSLKGGVYSCSSCIPAYTVPADGTDHAVKGKDYWDDVSVTAVDDRTIKFSFRKAGKVVSESARTVSADGLTLTTTSHDTNNGGNVPIDATGSETRIGAPVPGAHLTSGEWKAAPAQSVSDAAMTMTLAVSDGMVHLKSGLGETLDAKIGGPYAINAGDPGKTMTKVTQPDARTLVMTDMRSGKVTQVATYKVGADGKLHGTWKDPQSGATGGFTATKQ